MLFHLISQNGEVLYKLQFRLFKFNNIATNACWKVTEFFWWPFYMHPQTKPSAIPSSNSSMACFSFSVPEQSSQTGRLNCLFIATFFGSTSWPQTKHWLVKSPIFMCLRPIFKGNFNPGFWKIAFVSFLDSMSIWIYWFIVSDFCNFFVYIAEYLRNGSLAW